MKKNTSDSSLYAAIVLGSNSFHMLVIKEATCHIQTVDQIKRKVRLAAGLDHKNHLSEEAMERGWQCLRLFAERLYNITPEQVRIVATAALRTATNAADFLSVAENILGIPVKVISGEQEAKLIYQGVTHTTAGAKSRLVIDIGGGSTELITGSDSSASLLFSLPMGCVTWLEQYFHNRTLNTDNFHQAEKAAKDNLKHIIHSLKQQGWQICVGASGTVQALQEIMVAQGMDEQITLEKLQQLKERAIQCGKLDELEIDGLTLDRALVFPSGLSILIAIFESLNIDSMTLAGGALREGLIYSMLNIPVENNIRQKTIKAIQCQYMIDTRQAELVSQISAKLCQQLQQSWEINETMFDMLNWASQIHEIGLSVEFKQSAQHAYYLINNIDMPGFTSAQKKLIAALLLNQTNPLNIPVLADQNAISQQKALRLARLLRIAILLCRSRHANLIPDMRLESENERLSFYIAKEWNSQHPLQAEALLQESRWQSYSHLPLSIFTS